MARPSRIPRLKSLHPVITPTRATLTHANAKLRKITTKTPTTVTPIRRPDIKSESTDNGGEPKQTGWVASLVLLFGMSMVHY
ncbi:uncharacterized protein TrAFT101_008518 [Trichoderma asperellum]|uniref:uncharacterized protein n=1 Tax=Trichoderma asperellum TaxID=101201 RepID=UPI0033308C34|nr:hypothetical protein TrAFT101_008518 [Trichoderma asperellum]